MTGGDRQVSFYGINIDDISTSILTTLLESEKNGIQISESDKKLLVKLENITLFQTLQQFRSAKQSPSMTTREYIEYVEKLTLSPFATLSCNSKGREKPDPYDNDDFQTIFQRDFARILHSKPFKNLSDKTQVFILPENSLYTTRMTHTLNASHIGRSIARGLMLNQDLVEASLYGHDLGHTPFGHAGEQGLNEMSPNGFKHNEQSIRVVEIVGRKGGYNLSWEVRDAIINHNKKNMASTLEGQIARYADRIAYISHDVVDLTRANIIKEDDLPKDCVAILGKTWSRWINTLIRDVVNESKNKPLISMSPAKERAVESLKNFMLEIFDKGYIKSDNEKGKYIVCQLYTYFKKHPNKIPEDKKYLLNFYNLDTVICDCISDMTDSLAINTYNNIFTQKS